MEGALPVAGYVSRNDQRKSATSKGKASKLVMMCEQSIAVVGLP